MKTCSKCGIAKLPADFNRNRGRRDGLENRCKQCHRAQSIAWQRGTGKDAHRQAVNAYRRRKPAVRLAADRRTRDKHPLHWRARRAVAEALKYGRLTRPAKCQACGFTGAIQAHHWRGYDRRSWLDVQWLCTMCHAEAQRRVSVVS